MTYRSLGLVAVFGAIIALPLALAAQAQTSDARLPCSSESNPDLRIRYCTKLIESPISLSNSDLAWAFMRRGVGYDQKQNHDQAISDYDQAIQLNPGNAQAFIDRALAYGGKGEYDRAIQDFNQAVRLDPEDADAFNGRGLTYYLKGDDDRAIQDMDQAIRLDSTDALAFDNRGLAYREKGQYDQALQNFDQAIQLNPDYAQALNHRALTHYIKGEYDQAVNDYDQVIRLRPDDATAFNDRGNSYRNKGDYDSAFQDFDQAIRLNPSYGAAFSGRARAEFLQGQFPAAAADFSKASGLESAPASSLVWLYVANLHGGATSPQSALADSSKNPDLTAWPGPALRMFQGQITAEQLLQAAQDPDPLKAKVQQCQAHFYIGENSGLVGKNVEGARLEFQNAIDLCPASFAESAAAKQALSKLPPAKQ